MARAKGYGRRTAPRWTVGQLTKATEDELALLASLAAKADRCDMRHVYGCMANGAVALWYSVTCGWHTETGEHERLRTLADLVGKPPPT